MPYRYTADEIKFMQENYPHMTARELCKALNEKFGVMHPLESVKSKVKHIGVPKDNTSPYTKQQIDFIKECGAELTSEELAKSLNETFGVSHPVQSVRTVAKQMGVIKAKDTRARACANRSKYKIGDSAWMNGYEYIKVCEGKGTTYQNFEAKSRLVWEAEHGELPKGMQVVFLNGDTTDCRIENLKAISRKTTARMANGHGKGLWSENPEITKTAIMVCEVEQAIAEAK